LSKPLIGILTQPVADEKKDTFNYSEYILGINHEFIGLGGSQPVYLNFESDSPEQEKTLYDTLSKINGVLLTGGGLTLIDHESKA
jgi:hypothetical protein